MLFCTCIRVRTGASKRSGKRKAIGPRELLAACEQLVGDHVDLSSWQSRIAELERLELEPERDEDEEVDAASGGGDKHNETRDAGDRSAGAGSGGNRGRAGLVTFEDSNYSEHVPFKDGVLTIGCVGMAHTIAREFVDYTYLLFKIDLCEFIYSKEQTV